MAELTQELLEANARLFNEGCDARLAGRAASSCPYSGHERDRWLWGWRDVHKSWGSWVMGRWRYPSLPRIVQQG